MCKQDAGRDCVEVQPSPGPAPGGWSETGQPAAGGGLVCHPAQPSPSSDGRAEQNCGETRGAAELTEEARLNPRPPDPQAPALTPASQPHRQVSRPSVSRPDSQAAGWLPEGQGPLSSNVAFAQDSPIPSLPCLLDRRHLPGPLPCDSRDGQREFAGASCIGRRREF